MSLPFEKRSQHDVRCPVWQLLGSGAIHSDLMLMHTSNSPDLSV